MRLFGAMTLGGVSEKSTLRPFDHSHDSTSNRDVRVIHRALTEANALTVLIAETNVGAKLCRRSIEIADDLSNVIEFHVIFEESETALVLVRVRLKMILTEVISLRPGHCSMGERVATATIGKQQHRRCRSKASTEV